MLHMTGSAKKRCAALEHAQPLRLECVSVGPKTCVCLQASGPRIDSLTLLTYGFATIGNLKYLDFTDPLGCI